MLSFYLMSLECTNFLLILIPFHVILFTSSSYSSFSSPSPFTTFSYLHLISYYPIILLLLTIYLILLVLLVISFHIILLLLIILLIIIHFTSPYHFCHCPLSFHPLSPFYSHPRPYLFYILLLVIIFLLSPLPLLLILLLSMQRY